MEVGRRLLVVLVLMFSGAPSLRSESQTTTTTAMPKINESTTTRMPVEADPSLEVKPTSRVSVKADIRFRMATTEVTHVMTNDKDAVTELTFDMTLPKEAFIANFSMEIEGKTYPGEVKKKQEARQQYLAARRSGSHGALVEQSARHSNKFDVSVNIPAGKSVTFTLVYQELLRRQFGSYEYMVYLDNSTLPSVQEYSLQVYIQDRNKIKDVRTPAMRRELLKNEVEESENALTEISTPNERAVYVVYRPSPQELREKGGGWFVVQYDVESSDAGDLLVVDGYFLHFFMPPDDLPPMPLDIVFVLDISGSMAGRKLEQMKAAMGIILDDLRETDRFSILLFDGSVVAWRDRLQEASEQVVEKAQDYVKEINFRGATDLHQALMEGLKMLQGSREASRVPMIFFLTDGEATSGETDPDKITNDFSSKNEGVVSLFSLAFGAGADYKLLRQISTRNNGFARKIYEASDASQQVSGLYKEISTVVLRGLNVTYHPTSNNDDGGSGLVPPPLPIRIICTFPYDSLVYGQSDFVVAGKFSAPERPPPPGVTTESPPEGGHVPFLLPQGLRLNVSGLGAKQQVNFVLEENDVSKLTLDGDNPYWSVPWDLSKMTERAFAFLMIKQLLKEKVASAENSDLVKELDEQILELSLKYQFVTPLTSMVVTRPEDNLKKDKSKAEEEEKAQASFTSDDDVPAGIQRHAYASQMVQHSVMHSPSLHRPAKFAHIGAYGPQGLPDPPQLSSQSRAGKRVNILRGQRQRKPFIDMDDDIGGLVMPSFAPATGVIHPYTQTVATASYHPQTSTHRPPSTPRGRGRGRGERGRKDKKLKKKKWGRKNKKGGKKNKKCIRNKRVFLQSVVLRGNKTSASCYEVKASRSGQNYILFSDPSTGVTLIGSLKRKFVTELFINSPQVAVNVTVSPAGQLVTSPSIPLTDGAVLVNEGQLTINVNVTRMTCKVSFVSIDIDVGMADADSATVSQYRGIVVKALQKAVRFGGRRRNKGRKKKKGGKVRKLKGCLASNVSDDRAFMAKGKYLSRYTV